MNIQKNNYYTSYNTKFGARFPKADLQKVMSEISYMPKLERKEKLARLYTSLKHIDSIAPDTKLRLTNNNIGYYNPYDPDYYNYILNEKDEKLVRVGYPLVKSIEKLFMKPKFVEENELKPYGFQSNALGDICMPKSVYQNQWWKNINRNITVEDIEKFALDVEA